MHQLNELFENNKFLSAPSLAEIRHGDSPWKQNNSYHL